MDNSSFCCTAPRTLSPARRVLLATVSITMAGQTQTCGVNSSKCLKLKALRIRLKRRIPILSPHRTMTRTFRNKSLHTNARASESLPAALV